MTHDTFTSYDKCSADWLMLPPRSRLHHLEPMGVGTSEVESFTNYLARLAQAHGVSIRALIEQEIAPRFEPNYLIGKSTHNNSMINIARSLNGTQTSATNWTQIVEQLTLRNDLRFLTLLPWSNVLTLTGSIQVYQSWCPMCYEEWQATGQPIYNPLIWILKGVTLCLRHLQRLHFQCPICQRFQPVIPFRASPGHCNSCGVWLGIPPQIGSLRNDLLAEDTFQQQCWNVHAVGELLASAPLVPVPPRERTRLAICAYIQHVANGSVNVFAKHLELPCATLREIQRGITLPRLVTLLELCYRLGITPLHFLTEDLITKPSIDIKTNIAPKTAAKTRGWPDQEEIDRLRGALESILASDEEPPPSLEEAIDRVGSFYNTLRRLFPKLCSAVAARYRSFNGITMFHLQQALEAALVSEQTPLPTVSDIARQLGYDSAHAFAMLPEQCRALTDRHHKIKEIYLNDWQNILEEALTSATEPALTLDDVASRIGCSTNTLRKHFRDLCRAFAARQRTPIDTAKTGQALECIFAREEVPPPSLDEVARRLQQDSHTLIRYFPDVCEAISERYRTYRSACHQQRMQRVCEEVRQATLNLHAQGIYPRARRVLAVIGKQPATLRHKEVHTTWRDALRELGLKS